LLHSISLSILFNSILYARYRNRDFIIFFLTFRFEICCW